MKIKGWLTHYPGCFGSKGGSQRSQRKNLVSAHLRFHFPRGRLQLRHLWRRPSESENFLSFGFLTLFFILRNYLYFTISFFISIRFRIFANQALRKRTTHTLLCLYFDISGLKSKKTQPGGQIWQKVDFEHI